jgi:hypothetical protein
VEKVHRGVVLTLMSFGLLLAACGGGSSGSTKTADGNKRTCADYATYSSWLLSLKSLPSESALSEEGKSVTARLKIDGPAAESATLSHDAAVTVNDFALSNQQALSRDLNVVQSVCATLGYSLSGVAASG